MVCEQNEITNLKPLTFLSEKCTINFKTVYYATEENYLNICQCPMYEYMLNV